MMLRRGGEANPAPALASAAILALLGVALAMALYRFPPSWTVVAALSLGLTGAVALALARYETAVACGFLILGVVRVEPSPADGLFAVVISIALVTGRFRIDRVPLTIGAVLIAFLALNIISAVEAIDPAIAARFFLITLYLAVFSVWFTGYLSSVHRARQVTRAYVAGSVGSALLGVLALFAPVPGRALFLSEGEFRAQALFEDPNVFGPFLVPAALILLEEIINPRLLRSRVWVKALLFGVLVSGVLFSYSRAAWLNFAVAVAVMLMALALRRRGGRRAFAIIAVLVVAGTGAIATLAVTGSVDFLQERAQFQSYDVERFGAQRTGIALAQQYPFGVGPGQFEALSPVSTHSTYVRALAEQGLLGLMAILVLFVATLIFAGRNAVLGRDTYGIGSAALLGAWTGICANSLFVDTLHWRHLWFVAALVWIGTRIDARGGPAPG
jgi:O-antigen ligase